MESTSNGVAANGCANLHNPLESIDARLKGGDWLDELERADLLAQREQCYRALGANPNDFIKDTAEKTGITRSVLQRVRRITKLPGEVWGLLRGTKVADRQDLLVQLADRTSTMDMETALAATRHLIENLPAHGPRSTPKKAALQAPAEVEEAPAQLRIEVLEGLPISMAFPDGEPRIQDLSLAQALGYRSKYKIRELVKELLAGGHFAPNELLPAPGKSSPTAGRPGAERWFTEEQALFITTQAGTPTARTITRQVIRAFVAARRLQNKPAENLYLIGRIGLCVEGAVEPLQTRLEQIDKRLGALERSGFGARTMLLVPQVDPEEAGYSMEALNRLLAENGFNISETDTAIRTIAAKLQIIGDTNFGFWNAHSDRVNRSLSDSWRFSDAGGAALESYVTKYCELKMQYEAAGESAPNRKALQEVLDTITPIGVGEHTFLTRTRSAKPRQPFRTLRDPNS